MIHTACITVTGRVQGVYFRQSVLQTAASLGLSGFVMNQPDGSVYLEAQGDERSQSDLIAWCHRGSPLSRVDHVQVIYAERTERYKQFTIRR